MKLHTRVNCLKSSSRNINNARVLAALGVVAGLGLAAFPAFSYALDVSGDAEVETEVTPSLAMRIHSNADTTGEYGFIGYNPVTAEGSGDPAAAAGPSQATGLSLSSNQADTTTLYSNISIRSNTGKFKLEVTDADTDNALRNEASSTTENQYIPAGITMSTSDSTAIDPTVAGWAFKGGDITSWTTMPISTATPATIAALGTNTTNPLSYGTDITVNYAVSSGLTKTDTYSDIITYTATALDSDYSLIPTELDDISNMQEMNPEIVANAEVGASKTLTDSRDNNTYTVKKLNDGNIWMTQNLKLVGARTLTSADSNVTTNFTLTASNSGTWCQENSSACIDQSMVLDSGNTSYGAYYNWYAATAGTGTYGISSGTATASICPKGWRLPTNSEFQTLYNNYNSTSSMQSASGPAFVLSGNRNGGSTYSQGSYGYYWSSVAYNNYLAFSLFLNSSNVNPQDDNNKWYGFTVRCLAAS